MKKLLSILLSSAMVIGLSACSPSASTTTAGTTGAGDTTAAGATTAAETTPAGEAPRVALIMEGSISDMSWNYTAHKGIEKIKALGAEIAYQENVDNSALPDAVNTYASDGFDLIYLSSNSFEEAAKTIAKDYPETQFIIINGQESAGNISSFSVADEDQGFMQGVIAATLTKAKKVGFIGAMEITPILNGRDGFIEGVKHVDSTIEVNTVMTGSFSDVAAAKETAIAMIEGGADVLAPMADNATLGVVEAAEEKGALAIGSGEGQNTVAPHAVVCSVIKDTSIVYEQSYKEYLAGRLKGNTSVQKMGAADGVVFLSEWFDSGVEISAEAKKAIEIAYDDLVSGKVKSLNK